MAVEEGWWPITILPDQSLKVFSHGNMISAHLCKLRHETSNVVFSLAASLTWHWYQLDFCLTCAHFPCGFWRQVDPFAVDIRRVSLACLPVIKKPVVIHPSYINRAQPRCMVLAPSQTVKHHLVLEAGEPVFGVTISRASSACLPMIKKPMVILLPYSKQVTLRLVVSTPPRR